MARYYDSSSDPRDWTNAKLMREAKKYANLESFGGTLDRRLIKPIAGVGESDEWNDGGDAIREATRLYRTTWMMPILDEIERRFVKVRA